MVAEGLALIRRQYTGYKPIINHNEWSQTAWGNWLISGVSQHNQQFLSKKLLKIKSKCWQFCSGHNVEPRQNVRHFVDGMFKWIFLNETCSWESSWKKSALVQLMAWCLRGDMHYLNHSWPINRRIYMRHSTSMRRIYCASINRCNHGEISGREPRTKCTKICCHRNMIIVSFVTYIREILKKQFSPKLFVTDIREIKKKSSSVRKSFWCFVVSWFKLIHNALWHLMAVSS